MQSSIEFNFNPSKEGLLNTIAIANLFKANIAKGEYIIFEFIDIEKQIQSFLAKTMPWEEVAIDMARQSQRIGRLISIGGQIIKHSEFIIEDYFDRSIKDILANAIESVSKYSPIATTDNGIIFNSSEFLQKTVPIMTEKINASTPKMKNLKCTPSKF